MSGVDNRVVSMKFDNAAFETGAATTMSTLDKLRQALSLTGGTKGMTDVQDAAKKLDLSPVSAAVENVSARFLAMSAVAITVLSNITNRAVDAGIQMGKSLTLDQVKDGFSEYETKIGAIQTILANTQKFGTTLPQVTDALNELNNYADKTIYSFGEMTKTVGLFTNAGIKVEDATAMIKGFSNAAAASGANAENTARAQYQLSQALSTGTVRLMDWKSLTNAGMGNSNMKDAIIALADAMGEFEGTGTSAAEAAKNFEGSLENKWLSADVMGKYLKIMSEEVNPEQLRSIGLSEEQIKSFTQQQKTAEEAATKVRTWTQLIGTLKESVGSGWAQSFETILGGFDDATNLFSGLSSYINGVAASSTDARNELLNGWKELGGRDVLVQGLMRGIAALETAIKPVKDAFREIFPPMTAQRLYDITVSIRDFLESVKLGDGTVAKLTSVFKGFFAGIEIGWTILKEFTKTILGLFSGLGGAASGGLTTLASLGDRVTALNKALVEGGGIAKFFDDVRNSIRDFFDTIKNSEAVQKIADVLGNLKEKLVSFFSGIDFGASKQVTDAVDRVGERFAWLAGVSDFLAAAWDRFTEAARNVGSAIKDFAGTVKDELGNIWKNIGDEMGAGSFDGILDGVNVGLLGGLLLLLKKFVDGGIKIDLGGGLLSGIRSSLDALNEGLGALQANIQSKTLFNIAKAVALLTVSVVALSLIDSGALTKAMTALAIGFGQLVATMALLTKLNTGLKLPILAASMILLTTAVLGLSLAVKVLSTLDWGELAKGLVGVAALMGIIVAAAGPLSGLSGGMISAGLGMIAIAVALNVLAVAVKSFAEMDWSEMGKGLLGAAAGLFAISRAMKLMPKDGMIGAGLGVIAISGALIIMAYAVKQFASMDLGELAKGLLGVAGVMLVITLAVRSMPVGLMVDTGVGLAIIGASLLIMAKAIENLAGLSWGDLVKGLIGISGAMIVMAVGANAMTGALAGAAAILVVSASMYVMAGVLETLGKLSWGELGKGLLAIVVVLAAFGIIGAVLSPVVPALLALGIALLAVSAAFALFGVAAILVATAFKIFGEAGAAGLEVFMGVLDAVIERIPAALEALATGIINAVTSILEQAPALIESIVALLGALLDGLITLIPKIAEFVGTLITEIIKLLAEHAPEIIQAGWDLLVQLLTGIRDHIADVTTLIGEIIVEFLTALDTQLPLIIEAGTELLTTLLKGISDNIAEVVTAATDVVTSFIDTVGDNLGRVITAGGDFIIKIIEGIGKESNRIVTTATDVAIDFVEALGSNSLRLIQAGWDFIIDLLNGIADSVEENYPKLEAAGKRVANAIMDAFKGTLKDAAGALKDAALAPFKAAYNGIKDFFGINSPSRLMIGMTGHIVDGFVIGMNSGTSDAVESATYFGSTVTSAMRKSFDKVARSMDGMAEFRPTITPVLDLSSVERDAKALGSMLKIGDLAPTVSYSQASALSAATTAQAETASDKTDTYDGPREIKFEQNNYSPEALSTGDVYRGTKGLIAMAKEELGVP